MTDLNLRAGGPDFQCIYSSPVTYDTVKWSEDNLLAISTESGVCILSPCDLTGSRQYAIAAEPSEGDQNTHKHLPCRLALLLASLADRGGAYRTTLCWLWTARRPACPPGGAQRTQKQTPLPLAQRMQEMYSLGSTGMLREQHLSPRSH